MCDNGKIQKISLYVGIANLALLCAGGILSYVLIGQYEAKESQVSTKLKNAEITATNSSRDLIEINKSIQNMELSIKDQKDVLDIQGKKLTNELNDLELELKSVKNSLEITSAKLGISSDVLSLMDDISPKIVVNYDKVKSIDTGKSGTHIVHNIINRGKFPISITDYQIFVTRTPNKNINDIKDNLVEGVDYKLEDVANFTGLLMPDSSKPYEMVIIPDHNIISSKYNINYLYVTYYFDYSTNKKLIEKMKNVSKGLLSEKEILSLTSGRARSQIQVHLVTTNTKQ